MFRRRTTTFASKFGRQPRNNLDVGRDFCLRNTPQLGVVSKMDLTPAEEPYDDPRQREIAALIDHYDADIDVISRRRRRLLWLGIPLAMLIGISLTVPESYSLSDPRAEVSSLIAELLLRISTHLGVGLIVAAIAVFGYEWGSEVKNALVLGWGLRRVLVLTGRSAIKDNLRILLPDDKPLRDDLLAFIDATVMLRKHGDWARDAYLQLLTGFSAALARAARSVSSLSTASKLDGRSDNPFSLSFPEPAHLADIVLSGLMARLGKNDEYYAVSNARIWPPLHLFHEAHKDAIRRGASIRRIFVIFDDSDLVLSPDDTITIIYTHFAESCKWKAKTFHSKASYQMKVMTRAKYHDLAPDLERLLHFGAFQMSAGDTILFDVKTHDLSSFVVSHGELHEQSRIFDQLWHSLPPADENRIRSLLLTERIHHMGRHGSVCAITYFSDWSNEDYVHRELALHATSTPISAKRLFVIKPNVDLDVVRRTLRAYDFTADEDHGTYEWRVCSEEDLKSVSERVVKGIPFIAFHESAWNSSSAARERVSDAGRFLFDTSEKLELVDAFVKLWSSAEDVPQRQGSFLHRVL